MWRLAMCAVLALSAPAPAQTMGGVTLGAPVPEGLPEPLGTQVMELYSITVWGAGDGILWMSTTADAETGDVLYIEIWRDGSQGTQPAPIEGMSFGETTRNDLTERFGSGGMVFNQRGRFTVIDPDVAYFTSYEIEGSNAVVSFVTIQPLDDASVETASEALLDAISLGDGAYLDRIWGINRGILPGYERIADPFAP